MCILNWPLPHWGFSGPMQTSNVFCELTIPKPSTQHFCGMMPSQLYFPKHVLAFFLSPLTTFSQVLGNKVLDVCIGNVNTDTGEKVNNYSIDDFQVCFHWNIVICNFEQCWIFCIIIIDNHWLLLKPFSCSRLTGSFLPTSPAERRCEAGETAAL